MIFVRVCNPGTDKMYGVYIYTHRPYRLIASINYLIIINILLKCKFHCANLAPDAIGLRRGRGGERAELKWQNPPTLPPHTLQVYLATLICLF